MRRPTLRLAVLLTPLCLLCAVLWPAFAAAPAAAPATEPPPVLSAAALLPASILSGPNHRLDDQVQNDGYINIYTLHTPKGDLRVESTALLYTRIREAEAAAAMDQVKTGAAVGQAVVSSGANAVTGAFNLITHPIDTLSGAASGVGKAFSRADASLRERRPADDAGAAGALTGYNQAKRDLAKAYGVDPYSRNPYLQASLKRLASAGTVGGLTGMAAKMAIPGGVGLAVSATSSAKFLNDVDVATPPEDLFARNRERLRAMGVTADVIELFIENRHFSPTGQSRLVSALFGMDGVANKAQFINFCVLTDEEDLAFFRERMAMLYANIHATTDRLREFVAVGKLIAARTADGGFLCAYPLDYLALTPAIVHLTQAMAETARSSGARSKKLVVGGELSPLAAKTLRAGGWTVVSLREGLSPAKK